MYISVSYLSFCLNLCANALFLAGQKNKKTKQNRYDRGRVFSDYVTISLTCSFVEYIAFDEKLKICSVTVI